LLDYTHPIPLYSLFLSASTVDVTISNSIAVDPVASAVYIVSDTKLYKIFYDPVAKTLTSAWATVYGSDNLGTGTGRLGAGESYREMILLLKYVNRME